MSRCMACESFESRLQDAECVVDTLEAKCAWQAEMLARAKDYILNDADDPHGFERWLADLERGPKE